ncbi:XRE family transcriptional regulator [Desulfatibacillum aliphaticivorans]|uniref:XRE family transcriptional regulator n=1 Tax=Desulfatibacillum aliphaticivorans TaxID=218208 RepID=UPI000A017924|nr:helix-turn-helix transcriptional regulator [Desulfatibacillum aliphaticivorans]
MWDQQLFSVRIKERRLSLSMTQEDLANLVGVSKTTIQNYEAGASPKAEFIASLSMALDCEIAWLLTGEGPMKRGEAAPAPNLDPEGGLDLDEFDYLPMTHAELAAGDGRVVLEEGYKNRFAFRRDWLRRVGLNKSHAVLMVVRGDSMLPTLEDHDTVIVDLKRTRIDTGHIYAVNIGDDMLSIKRLESRGARVRVISDNKELYEPYEMNSSDIRIIGQVVWFSRQLVWNNND